MAPPGDSGSERSGRVRTKRLTAGSMAAEEPASGWPESWVVIYSQVPRLTCERFELAAAKGVYLVGRSRQCDIVVDSAAVSRQHARVERRGEQWVVVDLESTNGVYVSDARVSEHVLVHGERVQIGDTIFKHLAGDHADAAYLDALRAALVTDGLTQASNERAFRHALEAAIRRPGALSLVIADIDWFKKVNDAHGHPAGDRVLREFVSVLRGAMPTTANVGRVGGEEFAVLLPGVAQPEALALAERARAFLAAHPFTSPAGTLTVTASFGVAERIRGDTPTRLFQRADEQLYAAKREGRNRVRGAVPP